MGDQLLQGDVVPVIWRCLRIVAAGLFAVYLGWNTWWIAQGTVPPSLFLALTGLPCPTTGGTRALLALFRGDWYASLRWNPFAVPITLLCLATIGEVVRRALVTKQNWQLPRGFLLAWGLLLGVAWSWQLLMAVTHASPVQSAM